jgi:sigma-E factor negative regulatory protein RseB
VSALTWAQRGLAVGVLAFLGCGPCLAQAVAAEPSISSWLVRTHEASRQRAYAGTFVVSSGGSMASAKIWHVCDGTQQMERVEALTGAPRSTFRHDDQVVTFLPESKVAVAQKRDALASFPGLLKSSAMDIGNFYLLKEKGSERVAGFDADVVYLTPKDSWRYGYRVWSEKKTGLVIQLQTLDLDGRVMEQSAFSELQLDAPVDMGKLTELMNNTAGYRVVHPEVQKVDPHAEGWSMRHLPAGFKPMVCYKRPSGLGQASGRTDSAIQWVFSDGLATVSLFAEPFNVTRHVREGVLDGLGATHTLTRRIKDWWITAVGEVPPATLTFFAEALERKK